MRLVKLQKRPPCKILQFKYWNRLTDIFAVGRFDDGAMVQYQNLKRKPELFWVPWVPAPLGPGPGTMYPLNPFSQALPIGYHGLISPLNYSLLAYRNIT